MNSDNSMKINPAMVFFIFVFAFLMFFFTVIHPITIISGDDWKGLSLSRAAYPQWHGFNPIKVVPELSLPFVGYFSSFFLKPFGVDFFFGVAIVTAFVTSSVVTIFLIQLHLLLKEKFATGSRLSLIITSILFLYFFGMFKSTDNSPYLLWEINLTCYYHYVLPALMNGSLVIYLMRKDVNNTFYSRFLNGESLFLVLVTYLCIFSSIFASVILASYCGARLLTSILVNIKCKFYILKKNQFDIFVLVVWFISAIYEMNGGRASQIEESGLEIGKSICNLIQFLHYTDPLFGGLLVVSLIISIYFFSIGYGKNAQEIKHAYWMLLLSWMFSFAALILVCAKASPSYAERPVAMWGIYMYPLLAMCIFISSVCKKNKWISTLLPLLVLCLLNKSTSAKTTLMESQNLNLTFAKAQAVGENIISQVIKAQKDGQDLVVLHVPKGDDNDNWPFPVYMGSGISRTLLINGIIEKEIKVEIYPDKNLNSEYGIPFK